MTSAPRSCSLLRRVWTTSCVLLAAGLVWMAAPSARRHLGPHDTAQVASLSDAAAHELPARAIEEVRLGHRVAGVNPIREQVETLEPDPDTWRTIHLEMTKADGHLLWIELVRSPEWVEVHDARPGRSIYLSLPEMGAVGDAQVTHLGRAPPIESGEGTIVTGRFRHATDGTNVLNLRLEGQAEPTGVTENHPYWSVDRQEFVPAGDLRDGERLDTLFGTTRVVSISPLSGVEFLYNIETAEHVYRVGAIGTLVHNSSAASPLPTGKAFTVDARVVRQLADARMGRLTGQITPDGLHALVNDRTARRFFHARTGNINIIQHVRGKLLRITVAGDKFKIISVGPIQERNIRNLIETGGFLPLVPRP